MPRWHHRRHRCNDPQSRLTERRPTFQGMPWSTARLLSAHIVCCFALLALHCFAMLHTDAESLTQAIVRDLLRHAACDAKYCWTLVSTLRKASTSTACSRLIASYHTFI